ncbi:hypothetical protein RND71_038947 [Anisodus tanguticus]|uniref:Uncharacterized protein n=1 Tax=Anisodus tanguticus TaxID=243964 RepID=A0AAE1R172_9SOLA|nr:hypothetical protein RND71_038947 [Anisodus tanguticus]
MRKRVSQKKRFFDLVFEASKYVWVLIVPQNYDSKVDCPFSFHKHSQTKRFERIIKKGKLFEFIVDTNTPEVLNGIGISLVMVGAANSDSARTLFFGSTKGEQNRIWEWFFGSITDSRPRPLASTPVDLSCFHPTVRR